MQHIEKNEIFDLALGFVTETSENIFLTGKAGTGKTTFLKYLKDNCAKNIIVAAPTGVAAINAGGVTLHSLFQLPFHPFLPTRRHKDELLGKLKFNRQRQQLLRKMELLVVDEISMVRADVMDAIDTILRSVRRNYDSPFGGVQLLCIGDLYQLPPVAQQHEWSVLQEYYDSPFFFDSMAIKEQMPLLIELNKIYRQKEDSFVRLLNKVRHNAMDADDFEDLHMRYEPGFRPAADQGFITLTSHNKQADLINTRELDQLYSSPFTYKAEISGEFAEHIYPAEASLILREGAQVMFLKNDIMKRYFNGKIGIVKVLETDRIVVECNGIDIEVSKETWENTRYSLNRTDGKLEQETLGSFTQYPLRLAWAITIHKSQGLTFEKVMIDAGAAFSSGQVYVALSRCTSLAGIVLLSKIPTSALHSNENVVKGQEVLTHKGSLAERFAGARRAFTQQLFENIFSFNNARSAVDTLLHLVREHSEKLNPEGVDWMIDFDQRLGADRSVGIKFIGHIAGMLKDEGVVEKNPVLQQRMSDAAVHFDKKLTVLLTDVKQNPIVTEHKEAAAVLNEAMHELALQIYTAHYYIEYCKKPFELAGFLKHKLAFILPRFNINSYASGKNQKTSDATNGDLLDTLKRWRDMACEESGLPIYMVANLETLKELSTFLPLTKKDLMRISGFGKAKVDKYGDEILEAIESYCNRNSLVSNIDALPINAKKAPKEKKLHTTKVDTKKQSFDLYKEGLTVQAVASERKLNRATIEGHLAHYVALGEIRVNELVTEDKIRLIQDAVTVHGSLSHKTLIDNLPGSVSYGEIRLVLAAGEQI